MDQADPHRRTPLDELIGTVVANQFRVESVLGAGSMGVVFRASPLAGDTRPVALKVVLPDPRHQRSVPRLLRGARLAAQVKHPNVVETLAHGRVGPEREGYFVAMELVEGVSLGRLISAELDIGAICTLMCQVLGALAHMHARGVLHRDIKPDNVLVSRAPDGHLVCKISDFGIAADLQGEATELTQPGVTIGTPVYMAPEQMEGKGLDTPALDLYPVGVVLYEFLSGRLPFASSTMTGLMAKMTREAPPLLPREGLEVPPALQDVVMRLLRSRPEERYLMAADARAALEPFCAPAVMPARRWEELAWTPRAWDTSDLPAGWGQGRVQLAAGTGHVAAVPVAAAGALPLVGRDDVLEAIDHLAGEAEEEQGRAVLLSGGLGMGKSVVLDEVATRLAASGRFLVFRFTFPPGGNTRDSLRQALEGALGTSGRSVLHVKQVVKDLLRRHGEDDPQEVKDLVAFLRPAGPDRTEQGLLFALVHRCLRRFSNARPVLLCIDDLQRGGPDAAAFLEFLLFQVGFEPFPLLVVASLDDAQRQGAGQAVSERLARFEGTTLRTLPLGPVDEATLSAALVKHLGASRSHARQIARRAAGNPLFALYMARAAPGTQDSTTGERNLSVSERVPRALHDLLTVSLRNRLARTADPQHFQSLLENIAILGVTVDLDLVEAFLADEVPPARLERDLDVCLDLGLLEWSEGGGAELASFVPEVLRDVLVGGLNPRRARRLHRRAFEVRKAWAGQREDAEAGALGDHCEAAGRSDEAVDWWLRGQRYELAGGNALRGIEWGLEALACLSLDDARYGPCAVSLGRTLLDIGDLERAAEVLRPAVDSPDADLAMRAGDVLGDVYENQGAKEAWTRLIERLSAREHEATAAGRRPLYLARTLWLNSHGRMQEGAEDARRALEHAEPGEQAQRAAQRLVYSLIPLGECAEAERMARRALEESGDRLDLRLRSLRALGFLSLFQGRNELATQCLEEVLETCRRSGLVGRIAIALADVGDSLRMQGHLDEAHVKYRDAERAAHELGLASFIEMIHIRQLMCELQQGRAGELVARLREVAERAALAGLGFALRYCALLETWAQAQAGRVEEALEAHDRAGNLRDLNIDPFFVQMLMSIADNLTRAIEPRGVTPARADAVIRDVLALGAALAQQFGTPEQAAGQQAILDRLPPVHTA